MLVTMPHVNYVSISLNLVLPNTIKLSSMILKLTHQFSSVDSLSDDVVDLFLFFLFFFSFRDLTLTCAGWGPESYLTYF